MKSRSIAVILVLALLLILAFTGAASAAKPAPYWHKADVWIESPDSWPPGTVGVDWTEPETIPFSYRIQLDGPTPYVRGVPYWAPKPIQILVNLAPGRYKVLLEALDEQGNVLDRLRGHFVYSVN